MQRLFGGLEAAEDAADWHVLPCEADGLVEFDGLLVALSGRPFWRGDKERRADHALARSVLDAYRSDGSRLLAKLHGSFSLAVLDRDRGNALLAIDRMGIGRLAYTSSGRRLLFSTSAEAVARAAGSGPKLNRQALLSYLFFHMVPSPETIFAGVSKLPPGHVATFEHGRIRVAPYWTPDFQEHRHTDFATLKHALEESLRTAVRASDPGAATGAFLSGGLDSSTVAGVLSEVTSNRPARTFSIGFGFEGYDELHYARIANRQFGCTGYEHQITAEDIVSAFASIARASDEPLGNASALPSLYCARLARDHGIKHLLAGDGGDELFAGNKRYARQMRFCRYQRIPRLLRTGFIEPLLELLPQRPPIATIERARGYVSRASVPLPDRLEAWNVLFQAGADDILTPEFRASIDPTAPLLHMRSVWDAAPCASPLNHMLWYDWRFTLADNDLRKVESMCGLGGVEVSYPMLHPDVVEMSTRVPPDLNMPGTRLRHFYKRAMTGFLPDEIIHKSKHGFGLPFGLWLQQSPALRDLIFGNLSDLRGRGLIRDDFIDRLLHLHETKDAEHYGVFVWTLAMLEQWLAAHFVELT